MTDFIENFEYKGYRIKIAFDDIDAESAIGDLPLLAAQKSGHFTRAYEWFSGYKTELPHIEMLKMIVNLDYCGILEEFDPDWSSYGDDAKVKAYGKNTDYQVIYKNIENAVAALWLASYGYKFSDLIVEPYKSATNQNGFGFTAYRLSVMESFLGRKIKAPDRATFGASRIQAYIDGDVHYYTIEDSTGGLWDSCGAFVGELEYTRDEAKKAVDQAIKQDELARAMKLKELISNRVPLALRAEILAEIHTTNHA